MTSDLHGQTEWRTLVCSYIKDPQTTRLSIVLFRQWQDTTLMMSHKLCPLCSRVCRLQDLQITRNLQGSRLLKEESRR